MKLFLVALLVIAAVCAEEKYTTKYDGIDLDEVLKSDRLFENYFKCLMEKGKCTPDGSELKRILPDALKTKCSKCSEKQKQGAEKAIRYLIEHRESQWKELQAKYDPEGIYIKEYKPEAEKLGIKI